LTLVLVRHASAGDRAGWEGDDRLRPLDEKGRKQAERLPEVLAGVAVGRIVSSPYLRCVQTVEPLARDRGLEVEAADELGEERQGVDGPRLLAALLAADALACVHGGIELALGLDERFRKGAVWLFRDELERPEILAER
jgi:8-oxo-dGTP diphosphatase